MEAKEAHGGDGHAADHAKEKFDPGAYAQHHISDEVFFGVDKSGAIRKSPYDHHGHAVAGYAPMTVGPIKLEFTKHMFSLTVVALILFTVAMIVCRRVLHGLQNSQAPKGKLTNTVEAIIVYVRDELVLPIGGHHLAHYTPLFITYFLIILTCNLMGAFPIPFLGTATGNFNITGAMAISVYLLIWVLGIAHQGPVGYIAHLVPPGTPLWLWPLMFILEIVGPIIKCFVLMVRLFANMIAGHLIIFTILGLSAFGGALSDGLTAMMLAIGLPLAMMVTVLEVMVCFIQAYVFTMLAVIFIGGAVHPEH